MNDDYIREPDNQYNDTLLTPVYSYIQPPKITIKKNKKGKKQIPTEYDPFLMQDNAHQFNLTEEDIMRISLQEYENEQNKMLEKLLEHDRRIQDALFVEEQNKIIEELVENEKNKEFDVEVENLLETNSKISEHISMFETTKIQLDKLIKIDKNETYYSNIVNYITLFESSNTITRLEKEEYEKFLKIIKQIRIPENEKIELKKIILII